MNDRVEVFWAALGALTFSETLIVAETMRDACDSMTNFAPSYPRDWAILLNTARTIAEDRSEDEIT